MKINLDSPFITAGIKATNLLILNLYWFIGCLPIVTIGTSTIAAFTVTMKMVENCEEVSMTKSFWDAYRRNLKHGIVLTLILAAACYSIWIDLQLFNKMQGNPILFLILAVILIVLIILHYLYVFPLEARYENKLTTTFTNARKIFFRFFLRTLGLIGILVLQFFLFTQINLFLLYAGLFFAPILAIYTVSQIAMPIFRKLEKDSLSNDGFTITGGQD
jgi:Predicted integral membrane protein